MFCMGPHHPYMTRLSTNLALVCTCPLADGLSFEETSVLLLLCRGWGWERSYPRAVGWKGMGLDIRFSQACKDLVRHRSETTKRDLAIVTAVSSFLQGRSGTFFP